MKAKDTRPLIAIPMDETPDEKYINEQYFRDAFRKIHLCASRALCKKYVYNRTAKKQAIETIYTYVKAQIDELNEGNVIKHRAKECVKTFAFFEKLYKELV